MINAKQKSGKTISFMEKIVTAVFGDKIDEELQNRLRADINYNGSFKFNDIVVKYNIKSGGGIKFNDDAIDLKSSSGYFKNRKNDSLFFQYWIMDKNKPLFFFVHGNAESSTTHPKFLYTLLSQKYNLFVFDQIGYGDSEGIRGSLDDFSDYINNIDDFIIFALNSNNLHKNDIYLAGFSTGALEVLYYYFIENKGQIKTVYNVKKIFLFSPFFKAHRRLINNPTAIFLVIFSRFFGKNRLIRQAEQKTILDNDEEFYIQAYKNLTDNAVFLRRRKRDTRIYKVNSNRWISQIILAQLKIFGFILFNCRRIIKNIKDIKVYFYISENDLVVDNKRTLKIAKLLNLKNNVFISEKAYHDFLDYEDERGAIFYSDLNKKLAD